jgi:hypothetical protein
MSEIEVIDLTPVKPLRAMAEALGEKVIHGERVLLNFKRRYSYQILGYAIGIDKDACDVGFSKDFNLCSIFNDFYICHAYELPLPLRKTFMSVDKRLQPEEISEIKENTPIEIVCCSKINYIGFWAGVRDGLVKLNSGYCPKTGKYEEINRLRILGPHQLETNKYMPWHLNPVLDDIIEIHTLSQMREHKDAPISIDMQR